MPWRINKITINNLKFFHDSFPIEVDGKNLLIYGENGTGKSSIYWALHLLYQSCLKEPTIKDGQKYFDPTNPENLLNKYADEGDNAGVSIEYIDEAGRTKTYEDSNVRLNTHVAGDDFMPLTLSASDFMNYKFLSKIFNFPNSKENDVFNFFVKEIFSTLQLGEDYIDPFTGINKGQKLDLWWNSLNEDFLKLPHSRKNKKSILMGTEQYKTYEGLVNRFNHGMKILLLDLEVRTNEILKEKFHVIDKIVFDYREMRFNLPKIKDGRVLKSHDGTLYPPKIILKGKLVREDNNKELEVAHPISVFNEAKLTCMSLALRFVIGTSRFNPTHNECAATLVLDDLLISLDMQHRDEVVDLILSYADRFQIFILTHDSHFYDFVWKKISQCKIEKQWKKFELYQVDPELVGNKIPKVTISIPETLEEKAKRYFTHHDYSACANTLRKICEKKLKQILPKNWCIKFDSKGDVNKVDLSGMILKLGDLKKFYGLPDDLMPNIDIYRSNLLNPLSHDDNSSPIYRNEVKTAYEDICTLEEFKKTDIIKYEQCGNRLFSIKIKDSFDTTIAGADFSFSEIFSRIIYKGSSFYNDCTITVSSSSDDSKFKSSKNIRDLYSKICGQLHKPQEKWPKLEDIVTDKDSGTLLKDIV